MEAPASLARNQKTKGDSQASAAHQRRGGKPKRAFKPYHSINVPRKAELVEGTEAGREMTTVMLRNIPNRYTQTSLLAEINGSGFAGSYDFFYLPMDVHNRTNVGYAFINFVTSQEARRFFATYTDYVFTRHSSKKIGRVSPAHIQGFEDNVRHFTKCAVTQSHDGQYRPVVFRGGRRRDFAEVLDELVRESQAANEPPPGFEDDFAGLIVEADPGTSVPRTTLIASHPPPCSLASALERQKFGDEGSLFQRHLATAGVPRTDSDLATQWPLGTLGKFPSSWDQARHLPGDYRAGNYIDQCVPQDHGTYQSDDASYGQAFAEARVALEMSLSRLLLTDTHISGDTWDPTSVAGTRTGTPRSGCPSDVEGKDNRTVEADALTVGFQEQSGCRTPRTGKTLLHTALARMAF